MADIYQRSAQDNQSLQELELYHGIMDYRARYGLDPVMLSKGLTTTANRHVIDTRENVLDGGGLPGGQSLHTWSDAPYPRNGSDPEAMWEAPQRLGTGYRDTGYEISAAGQRDVGEALEGWQGSQPHNEVILNRGPWTNLDWNAIGIGVDTTRTDDDFLGRVYHVWFGEDRDPTGIPRIVGTGASDRIRGTEFADNIVGAAGSDAISGNGGADALFGSRGNDRLHGGNGHDRLYGQTGNDYLRGDAGSDRLVGGDGDDILSGGIGPDVFYSGRGYDRMAGGPGTDVFVFRSRPEAGIGATRDVIADFEHGTDRIDLRVLDADLTRGGDQAFDYIGGARLSGTPGELNYRHGVLSADVNGDQRVDFQIDIGNDARLTDPDFLL